jgi:hypothetical protein
VLEFAGPLAWVALAPSQKAGSSAPCGVEAKVSIERIGPNGTSAGEGPGSVGARLAVTLEVQFPAGRLVGIIFRRGGQGEARNRLHRAPKKVG